MDKPVTLVSRKPVERLDSWQQSRRQPAFLYAVWRKYADDEASSRAALLAYYGFLALFPLLLVLATVLRLLLHNSRLASDIIANAVNYFPVVGAQLQQNITTLHANGLALVIGLLLILYGARGVTDTLRGALDHIWLVPYARRSTLPHALIRNLAIIIVGGLGLAVTPVLYGTILTYAPNRTYAILSAALTAAMLFAVLVAIIKLGSSRPQPFRLIWRGALVAVVCLTVLQGAGSYVMARELHRLDALYGTFALVLGLIFWLYLQTQVLLLALEIDAVRHFKLWPRSLNLPLTPADHKAYRLYVTRARFHESAKTEE